MKQALFFVFLLKFSVSFAQKDIKIIDGQVNPGKVITEIPLPPAELIGTYYISDDWKLGNFTMKDGQKVLNCLLKYDLENRLLEIKVDTVIKVCPISKLDTFQWISPLSSGTGYTTFVNCNNYSYKEGQQVGVVEILVAGKLSLLAKRDIEIVKANYVEGLDMGSRSDKMVKKEEFFIERNKLVSKVSKNKNEVLSLFGDDLDRVKGYAETNKLKFNKKADLIKIFKYYNELE